MTNQPPDPQSRRKNEDEWAAAVVAFAAIGTVLAWGLTRANGGFNLSGLSWLPGMSSLSASTQADKDEAVAGGFFWGDARSEQDQTTGVEGRDDTLSAQDRWSIERSPQSGRLFSPLLLPFLLNQTPEVPDEPVAPASPEGEVPEMEDPATETPATETPVTEVPAVVPIPQSPDTASPEASPSPLPIERPGGVAFADVPTGYWALPFITALSQRGVISGFEDGTFRPDQLLTRAEYAAQVQQIFDQTRREAIAFQDVPPDYWATKAIDTAVKTGFLRGYPNAVFRPDQPIPRFQVLLSLVNGFDLAPPPDPAQVVNRYQDADQIPDYAVLAIAAATQAGVVVNYPDPAILDPTRPATRAEVTAMLYQALAATERVDEAINSPYIVRPRP